MHHLCLFYYHQHQLPSSRFLCRYLVVESEFHTVKRSLFCRSTSLTGLPTREDLFKYSIKWISDRGQSGIEVNVETKLKADLSVSEAEQQLWLKKKKKKIIIWGFSSAQKQDKSQLSSEICSFESPQDAQKSIFVQKTSFRSCCCRTTVYLLLK